jgi:UV DNA damage endonuclease
MQKFNRLGYCCINETLAATRDITANRGMIKRTFESRGLEYVSEIAMQNIADLLTIIQWNHDHGISLYRVTSNLFPWMSEYEFSELPDFSNIHIMLKLCGDSAIEKDQRLTFHPGPFNVLGSSNKAAVQKTIKDLNQHAAIFDLMGLECSVKYPVNIHVGGSYGDKEQTLKTFCENFQLLSPSAKKRLIVENDDKSSTYSVRELYDGIFQKIGIPITFDYHHHRFNDGGLSEADALGLAASTWPEHITQLVHYSSCKKTFEDPAANPRAHADWVYEKINTHGLQVDIEIESKAKELSVFDYLRRLNNKTLLTEYVEF